MSNQYAPGRIAIAICGRCSRKMPYLKLMTDPNVPGLKVCKEDLDQYDPYKLAPRPTDSFILREPRPDLPLNDVPLDEGTYWDESEFFWDDGVSVWLP